MRDIHPDIRKFYLEQGSQIGVLQNFKVYVKVEPTKYTTVAGEASDGSIVYRFNDEWFIEEEALKIIKIKAFL